MTRFKGTCVPEDYIKEAIQATAPTGTTIRGITVKWDQTIQVRFTPKMTEAAFREWERRAWDHRR